MEPAEMNIDDYIAILLRRKWSLIVPALIIVAIAVVVALVLPPVYKSTSTILIEEQEIPANLVMTTITSYAEQRLQSINQRIMSTSKLQEIINSFSLYKEDYGKITNEEIIAKMREDITLEQISAETVDRRTGRPTTATIAFSLTFEASESPNNVQKVTNTLTTLFLEENIKTREQQTQETSDFLQREMQNIQKSLDTAEANLAIFKKQHFNELPDVLQVNMQTLAKYETSRDNLGAQLTSLHERKSYLEVQLAGIPKQIDDVTGRLDPDEQRLEDLKIQLINLQAKFSEFYPDVIKTSSEIGALEKSLAAKKVDDDNANSSDNPAYINLSSQLAGVKSEISTSKTQRADFEKKITLYEKRLSSTSKVEEEYRTLTIKRDSLQRQFEEMNKKHMEANLAHGLEKDQKGERFTLIDPPQLPEKPFKPNRLAIILIGFVLGIGAGVGLAALREFSDNSLRCATHLSSIANIPVLATIPAIITPQDKARTRLKRIIWTTAMAALIVGTIALFHFYVMDLDILMAKISRR